MIDDFIADMKFHGFHAWQCDYCLSALWLEGDHGEYPMLMRMGAIHQDDCQACTAGIKSVSQ